MQEKQNNRIRIFTDGGYSIPRKVGAWAVIVVKGNKLVYEYREEISNSTSNRAELLAFTHAMDIAVNYEECELHADSMYVIKGFKSWMKNWNAMNWSKSDGSEVKNADLWKILYEKRTMKHVDIRHVKAHQGKKGCRWNDYVDKLTKVS